MPRYPAPVVAATFAKPSSSPVVADGSSSVVFRSAQVLLALALMWGAFAFGAVYAWAFWPLAAIECLIGASGFVLSLRHRATPLQLKALPYCFGLFLFAGIVQLVPVPLSVLATISPDGLSVIRETDFLVASGRASHHALSIAPPLTALAIILFASHAVLLLGCVQLLSVRDARWVARTISAVGVALALVGLIHGRTFNANIYGFWTPSTPGGSSFGPFVNRNHFAGWMLMGLPVALGLLCGELSQAMQRVKPNWRDRLLWFSSPAANRLVLLAVAVFVMALSLIWTMSRSGIVALCVAIGTSAAFALRRQPKTRWLLTFSAAAAAAIAIVAWVGADQIVSRFTASNWAGFSGRLGAWSDAIHIAQRFRLVGTGLNTYGVATHIYQEHDLARHYSQAHNDFLQLYAEGGWLLTLPAAACLAALIVAVRRRLVEDTTSESHWLRIGAVTGLMAIGLQELVDFSLQMPGNAALFAVLCAIALHHAPIRRTRPAAPPRKFPARTSS